MSSLDCCLSYAGDEYDNELRIALGHHPMCRFFPVEVKSFREKGVLARQVEAIEKLVRLEKTNPLTFVQLARLIDVVQKKVTTFEAMEKENARLS